MQVFTRSMNPILHEKMRSLIPEGNEFIPCTQFMEWFDASNYLSYIVENATEDWIVNLDEDCFITDWSIVEELLEYMKLNDYDYCGMPDGGVSLHRCNSWVVMNPFFNIINVRYIKKVLSNFTIEEINKGIYNFDWETRKPIFCDVHCNHNNNEPYCGFFYTLFKYFKPLYLPAQNHQDGISTIIMDYKGNPFGLHSWYSREYLSVEEQHDRIDRLYEEALHISSL